MHGYDFHRQKPLLNYIVDFYCAEVDLIIEIDGQSHNNEERYNLDLLRENELKAYKLTIIRFTEQQVRKDMENVLRIIEQHVLEHTPNPSQEGN